MSQVAFAGILREYLTGVDEILDKHRIDLRHQRTYGNFIPQLNAKFEVFKPLFDAIELQYTTYYSNGLNLIFTGLTGPIYVPSFYFYSNYCFKFLRESIKFLEDHPQCSQADFEDLLYGQLLVAFRSKLGGFTPSALEAIRFFFITKKNMLIDEKLASYDKYDFDPKYVRSTFSTTYEPRYIPKNPTTTTTTTKSRKKKQPDNKGELTFTSPAFTSRFKTNVEDNVQWILYPRYDLFNLGAILLPNTADQQVELENKRLAPLGLLHKEDSTTQFKLFFCSGADLRHYSKYWINSVTFFENLEQFVPNSNHKYVDSIADPFMIWSDIADEKLIDRTFYQTNTFLRPRAELNPDPNLPFFIYSFNTRHFNSDIKHTPERMWKYMAFRMRRKVFFGSTSVFLYIYDPKLHAIRSPHTENLVKVLRNMFSQGSIFELKTGLFALVECFKDQFDQLVPKLKEFIQAFKLELAYYTDLQYIPFSLYTLPSSYYTTKDQDWNFPAWKDKPIKEMYRYQYNNFIAENNRRKDKKFMKDFQVFLEELGKSTIPPDSTSTT